MFVHQRITFAGTGPIELRQDEDYWLAYTAVGPGVSVAYAIADYDGQQYEQGTGVFAAGGGIFVRQTVTRGSNGTSLVGFRFAKRSVAIFAQASGGSVIAPTKQMGTGTASGTVPTGATKVRVTGIAAGGNGSSAANGAGGGSGEWVDDLWVPVTAGDAWSLSVGAVGAADTTFTLNGVTYTLRRGANAAGNVGGNGGGASVPHGFGVGGDDGTSTTATMGYRAPPWHGGTGGASGNAGNGGRPTLGPGAGATFGSGGGAGSPWGRGGDGRATSGAGGNATGYGAGGGGGLTGGAGGNGAPGFLILAWEA